MSFIKKIAIFILLFSCIGYSTYVGAQMYIWDSIYASEEESSFSHDPTSSENEQSIFRDLSEFADESFSDKPLSQNKPFAMLLMGIDEDDLSSGRSDGLIVAIIDPDNERVTMLSIPRDTRVTLANGKTDKINAAYAYGGASSTIRTVENFLKIPIDYYVAFNMEAVVDLIDATGGVDVDVEKNMKFHDRLTNQYVQFSKGQQTLTGREALNYARFRGDTEGDFGRNRRQQQVIKALADGTLNIRNIKNTTEILNILGSNIKTDVSFKEMIQILFKAKSIRGNNIESLTLEASPATYGGISYVEVRSRDLETVRSQLQNLLNE